MLMVCKTDMQNKRCPHLQFLLELDWEATEVLEILSEKSFCLIALSVKSEVEKTRWNNSQSVVICDCMSSWVISANTWVEGLLAAPRS